MPGVTPQPLIFWEGCSQISCMSNLTLSPFSSVCSLHPHPIQTKKGSIKRSHTFGTSVAHLVFCVLHLKKRAPILPNLFVEKNALLPQRKKKKLERTAFTSIAEAVKIYEPVIKDLSRFYCIKHGVQKGRATPVRLSPGPWLAPPLQMTDAAKSLRPRSHKTPD